MIHISDCVQCILILTHYLFVLNTYNINFPKLFRDNCEIVYPFASRNTVILKVNDNIRCNRNNVLAPTFYEPQLEILSRFRFRLDKMHLFINSCLLRDKLICLWLKFHTPQKAEREIPRMRLANK